MVLARGTCHIPPHRLAEADIGRQISSTRAGLSRSSRYTSQKLTLVTSEAGLGCVSEKLASLFEGNLVVTLTEQLWRNAQPVL